MTGEVAAIAAIGTALAGAAGVVDACRWTATARVRGRLAGPTAPKPLPMPAPLRRSFERAGVGEDADRLLATWIAGAALALVASALVPSGRILAAVVLLGGPGALAAARGRVARRRSAQLPEALDAVAAGLRGGLALPAAVAGAATVGPPLGDELRSIGREVDAGRPLADAVRRWHEAAEDPHTALAAGALTVADEVGGPGARAVDGAAASLRDRAASDAEAAALATQGRASAAVLTLAPIAFAFVLTSLDPAAGRFLLGTPVGWLCIGLGLGLDAIGAWWMARLVRRAR